MQSLAITKREQFTTIIRELSTLLYQIQDSLQALKENNIANEQTVLLKQLLIEINRVSQHVRSLMTLPVVTLFEEEYLDFCDLLICGTEMAEYLEKTRSIRKSAREHAIYWRQLIQKFRPFLQRVLQSYQKGAST